MACQCACWRRCQQAQVIQALEQVGLGDQIAVGQGFPVQDPGDVFQLAPELIPADASARVTYSIPDGDCATVSDTGLITAVKTMMTKGANPGLMAFVSLEDLYGLSGLFRDFKAVREGNVWCTGKDLYQETDDVGELIVDIHKMLTGEADMRFLTHIEGYHT